MNYNPSEPESIEKYGQLLIDQPFEYVINQSDLNPSEKAALIERVNNPRYKGGMGTLIEEHYFGYKPNSIQEPDFVDAGVELKVTPFERTKKGGIRAGERLVITMISYDNPVEENFLASHAFSKLNLMLLMYYERNKDIPRTAYPMKYIQLFSPPKEDLKIIEQDYQKIITKVREGRADELSEGDTLYLGACTKGSTAKKSTVPQAYYNPDVLARKRAFCFKNSYMTHVLNNYLSKKVQTYEPIIKNPTVLDIQNFESIILEKINKHAGKTTSQLAEEFNIKNTFKSLNSSLAMRILGVKSNQAEEFEKANIKVKTIRLTSNKTIKESMSFPTIRLKDFDELEWEDTDFYDTLTMTKFLFVVFSEQNGSYVLKGAQFWNMPVEDIEEVGEGWRAIQTVVKRGVVLKKKTLKNGNSIFNNDFPKKADHRIMHIRPHASETYYVIDGETFGDKPIYGDELPDGRIMTKQSLWLNNTYILAALEDYLKA